eukprot:CAMPEP_0185585160 /NCGR_PEP_ID=MMETSP0434-20130131/36942_1 /TAXON_ID=626734 ORGANISM="Favella taraikaensis, Strain Fe Narragansett Bay" /NCGR_SAMPLE_ID=MMETSP0434 /ASSEMBLY_ACC=CAM_ASM_000379 /LENGTH=63 /DNA_ID=CAMNT_0028205323 /DNA_START=543 /DNA_END=734 /DNA_ORIENTATION=-
MAPGFIHLEEESNEPTQKRVSLTEDRLTAVVIRLFKEERAQWKVEDIATCLKHPREPISRLLK